ncbi:hypothetical protein KP509_06G071400 [Ceratopteris richardii]|uniref:Protein prenyltransferase alpha subunit repeat-containing protein 1 n=1 Tax=Ceratopteris richardii TaxID=49495 RepID=A0A8T2UU16_CERRI|nr:hypothetical protein KP509_06G071400 [Ceratopteris richardii]
MAEGDEAGVALLAQLESLLSLDHLIDEVGHVHPSQLSSLRQGNMNTRASDPVIDTSVFWCADHKLAISTDAIGPLYTAAKSAFISSRKSYEKLLSESSNRTPSTESVENEDLHILTKQLLSHSKALIILNPMYKTAWDVRRQVFVSLSTVCTAEECQLSSSALSITSKCEEAWAHRRWTIHSRILPSFSSKIPEDLLEEEFKLVTMIADRARMNYRAWRHCSWLVQWMSLPQVFQELKRRRRWAELHVAESSCFHYRRCLFQKLLTEDHSSMELKNVWLEEVQWIKDLIKRYIGREALWLHQRFLFFMWIEHFKSPYSCDPPILPQSSNEGVCPEVDAEILFANSCIASCINDDTEDGVRQVVYATTFKLWVILKCQQNVLKFLVPSKFHSNELHDIEQLLRSKAAYQKPLWDGLFEGLLHRNAPVSS